MSVLSAPWPSQPPPWYGHPAASFSALAAPVIPPLHPLDSPFPSPTHGHSAFSALAASSPPRHSPHPQINHHPSPGPGPSFGGVPPRNSRSLDRDALVQILNFLSTLLPARFGNGKQIRLVIHGGAVMLLNTELAQLAAVTAATDGRAKQRTTTRDIDYIARSFTSEWAQRYGIYDANDRLRQCTHETALQFGLGADWMNSDADVALPMATDPTTGTVYDPIHAASLQTGDSLAVYTSPNGLLKLVSVTPFWTVALKMVRYNPVDREDICILLRSGTQARQLHWTPARLEIWLLGTCWAMGYAGYDHERIKEMRRRMIEVVAEVNRWDPHAVADDGRGGVVPLHAPSFGYPPGYGYMQQPHPMYNYRGAVAGDPRLSSPFHSPAPRHTFTQSSPPSPFILGPAPTPPPPPRKKKKTKKKKVAAAATWSNEWTTAASDTPKRWDPESPERWDEDVWKTAEKEKKQGRMTSWIPWLKNAKSQPALNATKRSQRRKYDYDTDTDSDDSASDSDSEDEDWLRREQLKWGTTGRGPHVGGVSAGFQHNVADFMSNGMTPISAPAVLASGPAHGHGHGQARGPPVLPGWNVPGAPQSPQPWMYAYAYTGPLERQRSPPVRQMYPQPQPQGGPDMNQVAAGMNALGLYGV
ncbi:hypothetical protein B0H11DRAFT_1883191 [Mycena galericulata]|nr:hypothetical protein B0H11DRAFT_1883191 [Mycena galericulata]